VATQAFGLADAEVCATAAIDPEAAAVEAPGVAANAGRAADLSDQADIAAGTNVTPVSAAIVGRAVDDTLLWWRRRTWRTATTDKELGAAAAVDPEAATVYAPGAVANAG
jgi:hypothetical protein